MTFHLHIKGRVQCVGFRPHVYKCAVEKNIFQAESFFEVLAGCQRKPRRC
ncbi:MAG: acylphosphatase [Chitinophagaceae bacterium]